MTMSPCLVTTHARPRSNVPQQRREPVFRPKPAYLGDCLIAAQPVEARAEAGRGGLCIALYRHKHRPCVCLRSCQRVSTAQRARIINPGQGLRPLGVYGCPSQDFWASFQVCCPFEACFPPPRTRPAADPARLHAAIPGPAAARTTSSALATLRRPFPPF